MYQKHLTMKNQTTTLILTFILSSFFSFSQTKVNASSNLNFGFIENNGQVTDQNNQKNSAVKFLFPTGKGLNVQLRENGFSYDFYRMNVNSSVKSKKVSGEKEVVIPKHQLNLSRIDINFLNANPYPVIESYDLVETSLQFKNNKKAKQFQKIIYKNIYPNIDAVFYADLKTQQVKYDFIVHAGGDVSQIQLQFKGFDKCKFTASSIGLTHSLGSFNEVIPKSWIAETNESVSVNYKQIKQNVNELIVGFELPQPIKSNSTLVIDPEPILVWGTYLGDSLITIGTGVTTDNNGFVYTCGTTQSVNSLASSGAYQSQMNDSLSDAYLMKFNQYGICLWATYFGGNNIDIAMDVQVDTLDQVYLYGTTFSDSSIASQDAFQDTLLGSSDAFLAKFTNNGEFVWSTYFGGVGEEKGTKLSLDFLGNAYITGNTINSPSELSTANVHQGSSNGGVDAFVAKFDTSGVVVWSSYFGGTMDEFSTGISFGDTSIYLSGYTNSIDFISTDSTHQDSLKGGIDGYLTKWNPLSGNQIWGTYFGGNQDDYISSIKAYNQVVYFVGTTLSDAFIDFDTINPTVKNGLEDAFIGRVSNDSGQVYWSHYYGGAQEDFGIELDIEMDLKVILVGTTLSDTAIATNGVYQDNIGGLKDVFIAKFSESGSKIWGTYYGGAMDDEAYSVDVYGNTSIYITGSTQSDSSIINQNMFQYQDTLSGIENGFLVKFNQNITTMPGGFESGNSSTGNAVGTDTSFTNCGGYGNMTFCEGDTVKINLAGGALGTDAVWAWYKNGCGENGISIGFGDTISFIASASCLINVRAETVTNATECFSQFVYVVSKPIAQIFTSSNLCLGSEYNLSSSIIECQTAIWTGPNSFSSTENIPNVTIIDSSYAGIYKLKITDQYGCWDTTFIDVMLHEIPNLTTTNTNITCFGNNDGSISLNAIGNGPFEYIFNSDTSSVFDYQNLSCDTLYYSVIDSFGCVNNDSIILTQPNKIIVNTIVNQSICEPGLGSAKLIIDSSYIDYNTIWSTGNSISDSIFNLGIGSLMAQVILPNGCKDSVQISITDQYILNGGISNDQNEICSGSNNGFAEVFVSNGYLPYTYLWTENGSSDSIANNLGPGLYHVSITDSNGCIANDSILIVEGDSLIWNDSITQSDCGLSNGMIDITIVEGNAPFTFSWSNNTNEQDLLIVGDGTYSLQITDSNNCLFNKSYDLVYLNNLVVIATSNDSMIDLGESVQLLSTSNLPPSEVSVQWSPSATLTCDSCTNTVGATIAITDYVVLYTHESGCFGSDTIRIFLNKPCGIVFIPTAFSPNGDGLNDDWCVLGGCIDTFKIIVVNQWGETIFKSIDRNICWDGKFNGELVQNDSYVYSVEYQLTNGQSISYSGIVSVNH